MCVASKLKPFIEHASNILNLFSKSKTAKDNVSRQRIRDTIESISIIIKEDPTVVGDTYLADALYKAVMTCHSDKNEFIDVRTYDLSWYKTNMGESNADTEVVLRCLISEASNEIVKWGGGLRSNYFEIVCMYIRCQYHDMGVEMTEHITKILYSYAPDSTPLYINDYNDTAVAILKLRIDKEHEDRLKRFTNEVGIEYRIRMSLFKSNFSGVDDLDSKCSIYECELENELEERISMFKKQLSNEAYTRITAYEDRLSSGCVFDTRIVKALENMTAFAIYHIRSSS